jgi:hypothetical protein
MVAMIHPLDLRFKAEPGETPGIKNEVQEVRIVGGDATSGTSAAMAAGTSTRMDRSSAWFAWIWMSRNCAVQRKSCG